MLDLEITIQNTGRIALGLLAGVLVTALAVSPASAQKLVLYTASNEEIEKAIISTSAKAHPEIRVQAINLSTGPVVQRAIAEKANPQADVIWMINDVALNQLKAAGSVEPYEPKGAQIPDDLGSGRIFGPHTTRRSWRWASTPSS